MYKCMMYKTHNQASHACLLAWYRYVSYRFPQPHLHSLDMCCSNTLRCMEPDWGINAADHSRLRTLSRNQIPLHGACLAIGKAYLRHGLLFADRNVHHRDPRDMTSRVFVHRKGMERVTARVKRKKMNSCKRNKVIPPSNMYSKSMIDA